MFDHPMEMTPRIPRSHFQTALALLVCSGSARLSDKSGAKGMACLGSTYDRNLFDDIRVFK